MRTQVSTVTVPISGTMFSAPAVIAGAERVALEIPGDLTSCQAFLLAGFTETGSAGNLQRVKDSSGSNVTFAVGGGSYAALITDKVMGFHSFSLELSVAQAAARSFLIHAK